MNPQRESDPTTRAPSVERDGMTFLATARVAASTAADKERAYRSLFEHNPDAVYSLDLEGRFVEVNPGATLMTGYTAEELIGKPLLSIVMPEDQQLSASTFAAVLRGEPQQIEAALRHKSGRRVLVRCAKVPMIVDGVVVGAFGIAVDITEQRRAAGETRFLARAGALLAESLSEEVTLRTATLAAVTDIADACCIDLSQPGVPPRRMTAAHGDESREPLLRAAVATEADGTDSAILSAVLTTGEAHLVTDVQVSGVQRLAAGAPQQAAYQAMDLRSVLVTPLVGRDGVLGALWLFTTGLSERRYDERDLTFARAYGDHIALALENAQLFAKVKGALTGREHAEFALRHAQKMEAIGQLAGGVAHDFNNLLTVIAGTASLARAQLPEESPLRADLDEITLATQRATTLTRQLLAFSRRQPLQPTLLSLNDVVEGITSMVGRLLGREIALVTELSPDLPRIFADKGQVEQIILNLAVNGRDAMPHGGQLTIETSSVAVPPPPDKPDFDEEVSAGGYIRLVVRDTGVGMSENVRTRVFEPFFTTKDAGKGTGLGLATVYGIVKQSGGQVGVESALGKGSSFTIFLPVARTA